MTYYVSRDESGAVSGLFANPQRNTSEQLDESNAEVVAFIANNVPNGAMKQAVIGMLSDLNSYLLIADTATPAQVRTAVKGLALDMKTIIQFLANQVS